MRAAVLALIAIGLATSPARGQVRPRSSDAPAMGDELKAHWERGLADHAAHRYAAASAEFEACYRLEPRREFLFAWAQAARLSGDCARASALYRRYLAVATSSRQIEAARGQLATCEAALAQRPGAAPPDDSVRDRTKPQGSDAPARNAEAQDPRRERPEDEERRRPSAVRSPSPLSEPARRLDASSEPGRPPAAPSARPMLVDARPRSPWYADVWGDVLAGAGVAALAAGSAVYATSARDASSHAPTYDAYADRFASARRARAAAIVTIGAGSALVAVGVLHMILRDPRTPAVRIGLSVDGAQLGLHCSAAF